MTIKTLFFALFLYVCLVWVVAGYRFSGQQIVESGLFWTAAGLIAVLAFIIIVRLYGWWRQWRARAATRAAAPAKPAQVVHEDDAALAALIAEANSTLAKAPAYAGKGGKTPLSGLPLYLLIGPEASGKSSTFLNSGVEPQLLAGQAAGATRLCNLWLAKEAIFVEISGRAFSGELDRWSQLLGVLRGKESVPFWRRLWSEPQERAALRGVIGFCDVKEFTDAAANPQQLERQCRNWQERLRAIGEVFEVEFPVYLVITKCDAIAYFPDFFRRLPETEAGQVLGCTLPFRKMGGTSQPGEVVAEAEAKRLTASFRPLYYSLAERRLTLLAHEPDRARRPAIYEFPREVKRIRSPLVQFLTDAFRPHPLRPGPWLRGYYLTAVREVESNPSDPGLIRIDWAAPGLEATTQLFRPADATQLLRMDDLSKNVSPGSRRGLALRWIFVADLFHSVILRDQPVQKPVPIDPRLELYRRGVLAGVCALCALLCFAFCWSWVRNNSLLNAVQAAGSVEIQKQGGLATLADLQSLERLRYQVDQLRKGATWGFHWGLYSGSRVLPAARDAYFRRFQQLLLNDLNGKMVGLLAVTGNPGANDSYDSIYRTLKTHLMISSGSCKVEPALVSQVLKVTRSQLTPTTFGSPWQELADRQIDFYANWLADGNPCRITEDTAAAGRARQYLLKIKGVEGIYNSILANAEKNLKPKRLGELAPKYTQVLKGPPEPGGVFSREGWTFVEKASNEQKAGLEPCLLGGTTVSAGDARGIQTRFIREYIDRWHKYVAGFSVVRYTGAEDAAQKLEILADHRSPLLALFAITANETNFPPAAAGVTGLEMLPGVGPVVTKLKKKGKEAADKIAEARTDKPEILTPVDITRSFQPVHWVEPPGSDTWVGEKNTAYVDALAQLGRSMQEIARGGKNTEPALYQAASQNYQKALDAVQQIARGFKAMGVEGLDGAVQHLMEEPIRLTKAFIPTDLDKVGADKINGELHTLCGGLSKTLHKYPFQSSSPADASLEELGIWFAPGSGAIWKFQQQSLGELTVKEGSQWKAKDPAKKPQVTPEMLAFLNHAQAITDAFYPAGATQPQLNYTLRPKLDSKFTDSILELEVDGQLHPWTTVFQKQFTWPAAPGAKKGAIARIRTGSVAYPFDSREGLWGIFRIMGDATPRESGNKLVEWKYSRVEGRDPIQPGPVHLEIVAFPGNVDVFNPRFWEGLQCPAKAVQ